MPYAMDDMPQDQIGMMPTDSPSAMPSIGEQTNYRIARKGARPLRFNGSELAMAMSFTPGIPYWYEINIYRTTNAEFVAAVRLFHQSEDKYDTVEAWSFSSLEEALVAIETYDAASDVEFVLPEADDVLQSAEIAARAMELEARIHNQRQHYRGLVGEILFELDAG